MSGSTPVPPPPPPDPDPTPRATANTPMSGKLSGVHRFDLAQIGLGAAIFIASLLPFYSYTTDLGGLADMMPGGDPTFHVNAWHGFFGWFGVLLALAAAGVLAARLLAGVAIPSVRVMVLGLFGAAALCLLLALFVMPGGGYDGAGLGTGHSFGYWLALLCAVAATALAFLRKDAEV